ncbi:hypothetical protein [Saccharothrix violaceirubra]|uniref:Uncharacterized protein n=1 Tax=Saccharothrix violaceirubra TaxID=413306 RepID=A0A7W7T4M2_9PSEU|nr:hypothetical protein [Saccharothrix violaceirubra]MBB4965235.1 hypothetical protein [Saccharothrix violaceirubra]
MIALIATFLALAVIQFVLALADGLWWPVVFGLLLVVAASALVPSARARHEPSANAPDPPNHLEPRADNHTAGQRAS